MSRHTVTHFLKILYTGYTDALKISDFDEIHQLCQVLGVTFNDNSISTSLPDGTIENKTKGKKLDPFSAMALLKVKLFTA